MAGVADWGTAVIGRLTLREGFTLTAAMNGSTGDRTLNLTGEESSPPLTVAETKRRQEDILGLQDRFLPITFSNKSDHNGWYMITDVDTQLTNWTGEVVKFGWTINAVRVGAENGVDIESRLSGAARQNPFSLAGERWHTPAAASFGYFTGTAYPSGTQARVLADGEGTVTVYRGLPASVSPRWGVALADYNRGRSRVLVAGVERVATNITMGASAWEVNNGLVRVTPGAASTLTVASWDSGSTVLINTDAFTASTGSPWSGNWVTALTAPGGSILINGNAGRLTSGSAGAYSGRVGVRLGYAPTPIDAVALFNFTWPTGDECYPAFYVRSTNNTMDGAGGYFVAMNRPGNVFVIGRGDGSYANTTLGSVAASWSAGTKYWCRFGVVGSALKARWWVDGATEPTAWMIEVTDTVYTGTGLAIGFTHGPGAAGLAKWDIDDFSMATVFPGATGAWEGVNWNTSISASTTGAVTSWKAATVVRNDHELVTVRLVGDANPGRVSLDLTLRRGSRFVETYLQTDTATTKSWYRDVAEGGTAPASGAYIAATGDDVQGNRYFVAAANSATFMTTAGGVVKTATRTLDAALGSVVNGSAGSAGDLAPVLRDQYLRATAEQTMGVRR
jgi:hypothetical protein